MMNEQTTADNKADSLYWLYDIHGKPHYMAYKDYARFMPHITNNHSIGFWERAWLKVQKLYPKHIITERAYRSSWSKLTQLLDVPVTDAFLSRTDKYKPTLYEGFVGTEDRELWVVAHRHVDDAIMAVHQANFMHYYFQSYFTIVKPVQQDDNLVLYPVISRKNAHYKDHDILDVAFAISQHYLEQYKDHTKPALDYVHLNLPSLLRQEGHIELWKDVRALLSTLPVLSSVPVHGQMTAQHIIGSDHNLPVLVQYDRAGWHIPFYDWLHVQCQDIIIRGKMPSLPKIMTSLQKNSGLSFDDVTAITLIYLLDQLAHDLQDKDDFSPPHPLLVRAIALKIKLVQQLLKDTTKS
jgi:hypothetical protein